MAMSFPFLKETLARVILPSMHLCDGHLMCGLWALLTQKREQSFVASLVS